MFSDDTFVVAYKAVQNQNRAQEIINRQHAELNQAYTQIQNLQGEVNALVTQVESLANELSRTRATLANETERANSAEGNLATSQQQTAAILNDLAQARQNLGDSKRTVAKFAAMARGSGEMIAYLGAYYENSRTDRMQELYDREDMKDLTPDQVWAKAQEQYGVGLARITAGRNLEFYPWEQTEWALEETTHSQDDEPQAGEVPTP